MNTIKNINELAALYDKPVDRSLTKVSKTITPLYKKWILTSRFLLISTVSDEGCDCSPRGDFENLVNMPDERTIWIPDWMGNNRLDTLRNIVKDGRVSLLFMVHGNNNVVRINGSAVITTDETIRSAFFNDKSRAKKLPKTVIVTTVGEVYFQCAKALMRSELWKGTDTQPELPTAGDFLKEQQSSFDAATYDSNYNEYAKKKFW